VVLKIKIRNFEKYCGRKDLKTHWWGKLNIGLWRSTEFATLSSDEKLVWIALISITAEEQKEVICANLGWIEQLLGIPAGSALSSVKKCEQLQWLSVIRTESDRVPAVIRAADQNRLDKKDLYSPDPEVGQPRKKPVALPPELVSFLQSVYNQYPRAEGKSRGFVRLKTQLTSEQKCAAFAQAVKNYADECQKEGREKKYIKIFSTFCDPHVWIDYVNTDSKPPPVWVDDQGVEIK